MMKKKKKMNQISGEQIIAVGFIVIICSSLIFTIEENYMQLRNKFKVIWNQEGLKSYQKIAQMTKNSEGILNEYIYGKSDYINIYGLAQRVQGKRYVEDSNDKTREVYKTKDGMLTFIQQKEDMKTKASSIITFKESLQEANIPFLYVQAPYKVRSLEDLPIGVIDYANENADELLSCLNAGKVETLDLREKFKDMNIKDLYFITDHHWKIKTAFQAVNEINEVLNQKYNFNIDKYYSDINNYKVIKKEKCFLGSIGKRVGKFYSEIDDFEYIIPNFETNFEVSRDNELKKGSFEETIMVKELIEDPNIETNRYASYYGADYAETITRNKKSLNDKKVLVIQDSYGLAFSSLLSLRVNELRTIDLRHFNKEEIAYIKEYNPDIVIMMYNPSLFKVEKSFVFE